MVQQVTLHTRTTVQAKVLVLDPPSCHVLFASEECDRRPFGSVRHQFSRAFHGQSTKSNEMKMGKGNLPCGFLKISLLGSDLATHSK